MGVIKVRFMGFVDLCICFLMLTKRTIHITIGKEKIYNTVYLLLSIGFSMLFFTSCKSTVTDRATTLINQSIDAHGGMEKWQSLDKISYRKEITLYSKEKTVRKHIEQQHDYLISSHIEGSYSYFDSIKHEVIFNGQSAYKVEGEIQNAPDDSAFNSFNSAYYVLNMPWKLLDKGAQSSYEGLDTLFSGQVVESIKVEYTSGTSKDTWWYYFDPVSHRVAACLVYHPPTYNLITNDDYVSYQGLLWNHKRSSYRADGNGEVIYLMGKYVYVYDNVQ
jgi:hypothetical protein